MPEIFDPLHLRLHKPRSADLTTMDEVRQAFVNLTAKLHTCCPAGRERSIALTHLETAQMYVIKSLAIQGEPVNPVISNPSVE